MNKRWYRKRHPRGSEKVVDMSTFSCKEWRQQLKYLIGLSGLNDTEVAKILDVNLEWTDDFFAHEQEPFRANCLEEQRADALLTLLAYVLRLAQYRDNRFSEIFVERGMERDSIQPPPWDESGLRNYLLQGGFHALEQSLAWLNRN